MSKELCRHAQLVGGLATVEANRQLTICEMNATFWQVLGLDQKLCQPGMPLASLLSQPLCDLLTGPYLGDHEVTTFTAHGEPQHWHVNLQECAGGCAGIPDLVKRILIFDMTALRENWREAELQKEHYLLLNTVSDDILFDFDPTADTITFSDRFTEVFGEPATIVQFKQYTHTVQSTDIAAAFRDILAIPYVFGEKLSKEWNASTVFGECWFLLTFHFLFASDGLIQRVAGTIRNIDAQKKEQSRLINQTQRDPMTGLLNKLATENEIQSALSDISSERIGVLMVLDIDNFKQVNDTMGHLAGDSVLQQVALQLRSLFRKQDIIGRVGGDEFLIFMSNVMDEALIAPKAEMLCTAIRKTFINSNLGLEVSMSVGISFAKRPMSYDELFSEADIALYHAKSHGKNRFEIFGKNSQEISQLDDQHSPLTHHAARNNIMIDIIDMLFSMNDIQHEIDRVLYFIGNAFRVDKIFIAEKTIDMTHINLTHEWALKEEWYTSSRYQDLPSHLYFLPQTNENGIFYCSDVSILEGRDREFLEQEGITSIVQCSIMLDGAEVGYVGFEERGTNRIWAQQEVDTLVLMSKLLGEYIRRQRSSNLLAYKDESTRVILNSLTNTLVYVLSRDTHQLLHYNDTAKRMFPHIALGAKCHQVFWKKLECCSFCPIGQTDVTFPVTSLFYDSPFWPVTQMTAYPLIWENGVAAFVLLLSEYSVAPAMDTHAGVDVFSQAIMHNHEDIIDINPETGCYTLLTPVTSLSVPMPSKGDYRNTILDVAQHYVEPLYRNSFLRIFSLESMLLAFTNGANEVEMEFERAVGTGTRWKRRRAFSAVIDGSMHILMYSCDITQQKKDSKSLLTVLQHDYSGIYEIDMATGGVRCIHRDLLDFSLPYIAPTMSENVQTLANSWVLPEDRESFLSYFQFDKVRLLLAENKPCVHNFRINVNSKQHTISASIVPISRQNESAKALLLWRDDTPDPARAQVRYSLEKRFSNFFRQSCDSVTEIDLNAMRFRNTAFTVRAMFLMPQVGSYPEDFRFIADGQVVPEDMAVVEKHCGPNALVAAQRMGVRESLCQFRVESAEEGLIWLENRIFFSDTPETPYALLLIRDITTLMKQEKRDGLHELHSVLRENYVEIYEIDLDSDSCTLVFSKSQKLIPIDGGIFSNIQDVAEEFIHSADRKRFLECFSGAYLQQCFADGQKEISVDFRRLTMDKHYCWVTSTVVPFEQDGSNVTAKALLLVKDISEQKNEDQRHRIWEQYDRALRNIYDEVYELNVAQNSYHILYKLEGKYVTPPNEGVLSEELQNISNVMIHPDDKACYLQFFDMKRVRAHFAQGKDCLIGEFRKLRGNGEFQWASLTLFPVDSSQSDEETYLVFVMDIEAKKAAEVISQQKVILENQRLADERYKAIVKQTNTLVFEWFLTENTRYIAPEISQRFAGNYSLSRDIISTWLEDNVIHADDMESFQKMIGKVHSSSYSEQTVRMRTCEGLYRWIKLSFTRLEGDIEHSPRIIGTLNDVDETTRAALALKFRAEYDTLTGIFNAQTFYTNATLLLKQPSLHPYSVIRMDIDRFKVINDIYGMEEGDKLLRVLANLICDHFSEQAVFGRISGDIFCICVNYDNDHIIAAINAVVKGLEHYPLPYKIAVSFGICRVDNSNTPINIVCDWANLAAKTIKGNILQRYAFYDETLRVQLLEEKKIESEMNDALLDGQFVMFLQPKVDIATSHIVGAEALVRWKHPQDGLIPPGRFIPLFEKNGFITRLDECIWEQACAALRKWLDADFYPVPISVNVSRMHFHGNTLSDKLLKLVERYQIPPELLELEVTETAFMENQFDVGDIMRSLQSHGFRFSMDDFGSGYSSLTMLKSLPINIIKIDREFLSESVTSDNGQIIIRHTISMAQQMNLRVIAEGVETLDQALFLLEAGCGYAQGFLYSRPVPLDEFAMLAFSADMPFLPSALKPSAYKEKF